MEVILLQDIEKLGTRGQLVKVADGFGRNYLLPKKMAVAATTQNRKWVEQQRVKFLKLEAEEKAVSEELAKLMEGVSVTITRKVGEHVPVSRRGRTFPRSETNCPTSLTSL